MASCLPWPLQRSPSQAVHSIAGGGAVVFVSAGRDTQRGILGTKLVVPRPPPGMVPRDRLLDMLEEGARHPLTLVSAPAGSGKTALVAWWLGHRRSRGRVAWLSLGREERDREHFWIAVTAALRDALGPSGAVTPAPRTAVDAYLPGLFAALARTGAPVLLVLDDLHEVTDPPGGRGHPAAARPCARPAEPGHLDPRRSRAASPAPAHGRRAHRDPRARPRVHAGGDAPAGRRARPGAQRGGQRPAPRAHGRLGGRGPSGRALAGRPSRSPRLPRDVRRRRPRSQRLPALRGPGAAARRDAGLPPSDEHRGRDRGRAGRRAHRSFGRGARAGVAPAPRRDAQRPRRSRALVSLPPPVSRGPADRARPDAARRDARAAPPRRALVRRPVDATRGDGPRDRRAGLGSSRPRWRVRAG